MEKFTPKILKKAYLRELLDEFWFVPCEAILRAPEVAMWANTNFKRPVLDIGCGDGRLDKYVFRNKTIDVGMDNSAHAISGAEKSGYYIKTVLGDAEKMPFKNRQFNTVVSNSTFEHIRKDIRAVKEVARVLSPGGHFIFTTTTDLLKKEFKSVVENPESIKKYDKRVDHFHYRSLKDWIKILETAGFNVDYYQYYVSKESLVMYWFLYRISVFKPYKRELWSYLKDSPYGKLFPRKIISYLNYLILYKLYHISFNENGVWIYIDAVKK